MSKKLFPRKCTCCGKRRRDVVRWLDAWWCPYCAYLYDYYTLLEIPPYTPTTVKAACGHIVSIKDMPADFSGLCDACLLESQGASH